MVAAQPVDYDPYPIANFTEGLDLRREPWLTPPQAWREMVNAHPFRGRIWKRLGYEDFGQLALEDDHTLVGSNGQTAIDSATYGALNPTVSPAAGDYKVSFACGGGKFVTDLGGTGWLGRFVPADVIGVLGGVHYSGTISYPPAQPETIQFTDGTLTISFLEDGTPVGDYDLSHWETGGNQSTFNWMTGAYDIWFSAVTVLNPVAIYQQNVGTITYETGDYSFVLWTPATGGDIVCSYRYYSATVGGDPNAVMGLRSYFPLSGSEYLFAFDRTRHWKWNSSTMVFDPQTPDLDLWTGGPGDFFRTTYIDDKLVITNGVDPLTYRDGSSLEEVHTDFDKTAAAAPPASPPAAGWTEPAPYERNIDTAFLVFTIKRRLVLLRTKEDFGAGGTWRPQRARWSKVNPDLDEGSASWNINDFKDADTEDWIVGAGFIGEDLIVWFERSVWKLAWKDDYRDPFEWIRISKLFGSVAPMSPIEREEDVVAVGKTSLVKCDGDTASLHGPQVHDMPAGWNQSNLQYSYGIRVDEQRAIWHTYVDNQFSYPENLLVHNYEDDCFSTFEMPVHCFGRYTNVGALLWDDINQNWNLVDYPFDDKAFAAGFPAILAGLRSTMKVVKLFASQGDNGEPISFRIKSARLNPYQQGGRPQQRARLGFVDIVASANAEVNLTINFMADFSDFPYKTATMNLGGADGQEKVIRRFVVNRTARWHRIEILETSTVNFAIDAIIPWFQADGDIRQLSADAA